MRFDQTCTAEPLHPAGLLCFSCIFLTALNNVQQGSRVDFWRVPRQLLGIYKYLEISLVKCSTRDSFSYLLNFYETVTLKGFRPEMSTCTEYYMGNNS